MTAALMICALGSFSVLAAPNAAARPAVIENDLVRVALDEHLCLAELVNRQSDWNYAGRRCLWRLFYRQSDRFDAEAFAAGAPTITREPSVVKLRYDSLESSAREPLNISVALRFALEPKSDDVQCAITVENREAGVTLTEVQFPLVGNCHLQAEQSLIWSCMGGQRFTDPKAAIRSRHSGFMAPDQNGIQMAGMYPGGGAATNCFVFAGPSEGLYFGSHDPSLQDTLHLFRLHGGELDAGFVKYPFLRGPEVHKCRVRPFSLFWELARRGQEISRLGQQLVCASKTARVGASDDRLAAGDYEAPIRRDSPSLPHHFADGRRRTLRGHRLAVAVWLVEGGNGRRLSGLSARRIAGRPARPLSPR